ncbi:MAG: hypothetical protein M1821_006665 [Bathelium mastoideum]|nr:MAG: hypothetical protein M1821_006665 [Bathelium mastoideum]
MAPPSQLAIATSVVQRLLKEDKSYQSELKQQQERIQRAEEQVAHFQEGDSGNVDENAEYVLNQERKAMEETKAVFPSLRKRTEEAVTKLEQQLEHDKESASVEEINAAKDAILSGKKSLREIA